MSRVRVAGIVKIGNGIAFMHRTNVNKPNAKYKEYYTFPGGGLEGEESIEEGTIREIKEEFGINVKIVRKLYEIYIEKFEQKEYFFLCEYVSGEFGTGEGPEFLNDPKYIDSGNYIPEIVELSKIKDLLLLPENIKDKLLEDIEKGII